MLDGDPGTNKSSLAIDLAARISRGLTMPDGTESIQRNVLLMAGQDSIAKTTRQRILSAGADLDRIAVFNKSPNLPVDLPMIEDTVNQLNPRLLVLDPIVTFMSANINNDQVVRAANAYRCKE